MAVLRLGLKTQKGGAALENDRVERRLRINRLRGRELRVIDLAHTSMLPARAASRPAFGVPSGRRCA